MKIKNKNRIILFRDNPDVDIVGANMYHCLLQQDPDSRKSISGYDLISDSKYLSATSCDSILVCTGVYDPNKQLTAEKEHWKIPTITKHDVLEAVQYILKREEYSLNL